MTSTTAPTSTTVPPASTIAPTGTAVPPAGIPAAAVPSAEEIPALRARIDEVDAALIALWQERSEISKRVGAARMAAGGTRLVLSREQQIVDRFRTALGTEGTALAMLLLRSGRGPL
jgi:chorismate mutase